MGSPTKCLYSNVLRAHTCCEHGFWRSAKTLIYVLLESGAPIFAFGFRKNDANICKFRFWWKNKAFERRRRRQSVPIQCAEGAGRCQSRIRAADRGSLPKARSDGQTASSLLIPLLLQGIIDGLVAHDTRFR